MIPSGKIVVFEYRDDTKVGLLLGHETWQGTLRSRVRFTNDETTFDVRVPRKSIRLATDLEVLKYEMESL